jgi:hypothetical protein
VTAIFPASYTNSPNVLTDQKYCTDSNTRLHFIKATYYDLGFE